MSAAAAATAATTAEEAVAGGSAGELRVPPPRSRWGMALGVGVEVALQVLEMRVRG